MRGTLDELEKSEREREWGWHTNTSTHIILSLSYSVKEIDKWLNVTAHSFQRISFIAAHSMDDTSDIRMMIEDIVNIMNIRTTPLK